MNSSYRRRQRQIAEVLVRYEMGHLLEMFGLERFVALERRPSDMSLVRRQWEAFTARPQT